MRKSTRRQAPLTFASGSSNARRRPKIDRISKILWGNHDIAENPPRAIKVWTSIEAITPGTPRAQDCVELSWMPLVCTPAACLGICCIYSPGSPPRFFSYSRDYTSLFYATNFTLQDQVGKHDCSQDLPGKTMSFHPSKCLTLTLVSFWSAYSPLWDPSTTGMKTKRDSERV